MRVLALDAATEACSVALLVDAQLIGRFEAMSRGHSERLLDMVDAVLAEAQLSLSALDGIAASIGPGSFTGVRITVAAAQGLAFGAGLRVAAVSTLEALALQVLHGAQDRALACLDARMAEVYWGTFAWDAVRGLAATSPPRVSAPQGVSLPDAAPHRGIGRGFAAYPLLDALAGLTLRPGDAQALPNAREIALLGARRLSLGEGADPADLVPQYLRNKVALTEAERGHG
jgi:tRNA threonylcarbamoyladenosine biosynthesis protein TsaB